MPLDAADRPVVRFDQGQTPPTNVAWSVSMHVPPGLHAPNAIDRCNVAM